MTQTAVSHQIKLLEAHLGTRLFRRLPRGLTLTRAGSAWAAELHDIFARLHDANRRLRAHPRPQRTVVSITAIPSFAARWLVPRLGRFMQAHPRLDVYISSTEHLVDFTVETFDLGIRYGAGDYPGLRVETLSGDALVLVCAPALVARRRLKNAADLRHHVLLHDDAPQGWAAWLASQHSAGADRALLPCRRACRELLAPGDGCLPRLVACGSAGAQSRAVA